MANDKVISTQALIEKFEEALRDDWGYIWGTAGELWTAAKQEALEKTTDADREQGRKYGKKWIGHRVADCSGLFKWAFKQLGGYMYHGSDTMFRKYTTARGTLKAGRRTDGLELLPGTAVFVWKESKGKYTHVGLYIGGGYVIEAASTINGVIKGKVSASKWTHWGKLKGVEYAEEGTDPTPEPAPDPKPVKKQTIRKGNRGALVKEMQTMLDRLGYSLGICGIDGDYGVATEKAVKEFQRDHRLEQDGVCGPKTWEALQEAVDRLKPDVEKESWTVTIKGLTKEQAEELCRAWKDATSKKE